MAIPHIRPGQVVDALPTDANSADAKTVALFKSQNLEVMRLVLQTGKSLPPHKVAGEITIHCIEGIMSVTTEGAIHTLHKGQLLYLRGNELHGVHALEYTCAIVTVALIKKSMADG